MYATWKFIKAANFFPKYLPEIKDWKRKMSGKNGRGNPLEFSADEKKQIRRALDKLFKDLKPLIK